MISTYYRRISQHMGDEGGINTRTKKKSKMKKRGVVAMVAVSVFILLNIAVEEETIHRFLTVNLGGGKCKWSAPVAMSNTTNPLNTTTLLASYPGSGKRLTWRLLEALTGKISGDDWDLSENGHFNVLTMKTSWPHPEGVWAWEGNMDQFIMLIRNPRFAIPSYHTIRHELDYSTNKTESLKRRDYVYTKRAPLEAWEAWRDENFDREMDRWCWFIDFWMEGGLRRNGTVTGNHTNPAEDWRCFHDLMDCTPKAVIKFENLVNNNKKIGEDEMNKMGAVLDSSSNVNVIEPEIRPCAYSEVMSRKKLYNANRDGKGPPNDLKTFTHKQLNAMRAQMEVIRDKYAASPWNEKETAVNLVEALNSYIDDVQGEYEFEVRQYYSKQN